MPMHLPGNGPQLGSMLGMPTGLFITTLFYVTQIFVFNDSFGQQQQP